jgi:hypothetical protein
VYVSVPVPTEQTRANADAGSTGMNVITFPLDVACTMPLTGSPVSGST